MRSTLHLKFFIAYAIFAFLTIFSAALLGNSFSERVLISNAASELTQEGSLFATSYLPEYFSEELTREAVQQQLDGIAAYAEAEVWLLDTSGEMLISSENTLGESTPESIPEFDPAETGRYKYIIGNYHGCFPMDVITTIAPVTNNFTTTGYLLIHKPLDSISGLQTRIMEMIYITVAVVLIFSLLILIVYQIFVHIPLRKITEAATQYAAGNLSYHIELDRQDEMGYLSASLNYMADQLNDIQKYQKQFIGNVSHDFRSPLTSIKGYVQAMADGTIPPELQEKYLNIILFETERLTDLTTDLLTLNQFDLNGPLLNPDYFDIHEIIKNTVSSFEGICKSRKISIGLLLASRELIVYADKGKIQQVIYNLLDNAIKFSNNESEIIIETTDRHHSVLISVRDNGIGIPKQSLPKIWDRFYKSDLSRGKDKKGTGLGLAIVKEIIQAHGENIYVVSTEGVGTEFSFTLSKFPNKKTGSI